MSQPTQPLTYVENNNIPATESKSLIWWLIFICFAYHYRIVVCGFFGNILGYKFLCHTWIHGVMTNHWFEQLVYVPLLWYAFYKTINIVFGPGEFEVIGSKVQRLKTMAYFMLAMYIYGTGIHFANTIEIFARTYLHISSGALYDQIYWVDEQLSHQIQYMFYFPLFALLIMHDRLDRRHGAYAAVFTGLLHGLERGILVIEGDSPRMALIYTALILIACLYRLRKHNNDFTRVWQDFFFRHGITFGLSMPVAIFVYQLVFGDYVQPSAMGKQAWLVLVFAALFTAVGFLLAVLVDKALAKRERNNE